MHCTTLSMLDDQALTDAFNVVYEDYVVPLRMTVDQMRLHIAANTISREHSPLLLDDTGMVVGLGALGIRDNRGWIGGFGLAVPARGQGLSQVLMRALLEAAQRLGLRHVQLEVLCNNLAAIRVYERAGFVQTRELRFLVRDAATSFASTSRELVTPAATAEILAHADRLHPSAPCWQRESASLAATPELHGFVAGSPEMPTAYILGRASDVDLRIADVAAADVAVVPALLDALTQRFPGRRLVLSNEPADSAIGLALEQQGWYELLRQYEMVYNFT